MTPGLLSPPSLLVCSDLGGLGTHRGLCPCPQGRWFLPAHAQQQGGERIALTYSPLLPVGMKFGKAVRERRVDHQRDVAPKFSAHSLQVQLELGLGFSWAYSKLPFFFSWEKKNKGVEENASVKHGLTRAERNQNALLCASSLK